MEENVWDQSRKEEVMTLGRKLNEARLGDAQKHPSALDLHLAVVALNHAEEQAEYEYAIAMRRSDLGRDWAVSTSWKADLERERRGMVAMQKVCKEKNYPFEYKLVKRRKPREAVVEDV
jgi:hypothetical protein